ncbi:MAG: MFS transporter [Coxiellaceae bacterium]|nr:MFS transporter [Coxiellaceae bacterium]
MFSIVAGLYLVLPIYFYDVYKLTHVQATFLVTMYLVGRAIGIVTYARLINYAIKNFQYNSISSQRLYLAFSGFICAVLLIMFNYVHAYHHMLIIIILMGCVASVFGSLNLAIMNGNVNSNGQIKHASFQRWFQNIGMMSLFVIFWIVRNHNTEILFIVSGILLIAVLIECLLISNKSTKFQNHSQENSRVSSVEVLCKKFFILAFFSLVVFMQIPNLYAYYLHDYYHIGSSYFSGLMVLNCVIVILFQLPLSNIIIKKIKKNTSAAYGLCFIGVGAVLPLCNNIAFVYVSFIVWTIGEIFLFTAMKAYLILFSSHDAGYNVSISTKYYTMFYLSGLVCPIVMKYMYGTIHQAHLLLLVSLFAWITAIAWIFSFKKGNKTMMLPLRRV